MRSKKTNDLFAGFIGKEDDDNMLSAKEIAFARKIVSSKDESIAFLKRAGILNRNGNLAMPYR